MKWFKSRKEIEEAYVFALIMILITSVIVEPLVASIGFLTFFLYPLIKLMAKKLLRD